MQRDRNTGPAAGGYTKWETAGYHIINMMCLPAPPLHA